MSTESMTINLTFKNCKFTILIKTVNLFTILVKTVCEIPEIIDIID